MPSVPLTDLSGACRQAVPHPYHDPRTLAQQSFPAVRSANLPTETKCGSNCATGLADMAVSRNPVPDGPRGQASVSYIPLKRGACYIPLVARCRAAIKDLEYSWYGRACRARRAPVTYPL